METKKFKEIDEGFICENCNKKVSPLGYTSRDHCPYCLYSMHVDINPGDRQNSCKIDKQIFKKYYRLHISYQRTAGTWDLCVF